MADLATRVTLIGPAGAAIPSDVSLLVAAIADGILGILASASAASSSLVVAALRTVAADVAGIPAGVTLSVVALSFSGAVARNVAGLAALVAADAALILVALAGDVAGLPAGVAGLVGLAAFPGEVAAPAAVVAGNSGGVPGISSTVSAAASSAVSSSRRAIPGEMAGFMAFVTFAGTHFTTILDVLNFLDFVARESVHRAEHQESVARLKVLYAAARNKYFVARFSNFVISQLTRHYYFVNY